MKNLVVVKQAVAVIEWDKEVALKEANEIMAKYEGLEFTEEQLPMAKKEVATLRKVSKEINSQALAIDKELTAPVKEFRNEVKEVKGIIDNGIDFINEQVKLFEDKQKAERKEEILQMESYQDVSEYVEFDDTWLLKKFTDDKLEVLFTDLKEHINSQINTIKMMCTSHNIDSDKYVDRLKTRSLEEILEQIADASVTIAEVKKEEPKVIEVNTDEKEITITRNLTGTMTALKMLNEYATKLGIGWTK